MSQVWWEEKTHGQTICQTQCLLIPFIYVSIPKNLHMEFLWNNSKVMLQLADRTQTLYRARPFKDKCLQQSNVAAILKSSLQTSWTSGSLRCSNMCHETQFVARVKVVSKSWYIPDVIFMSYSGIVSRKEEGTFSIGTPGPYPLYLYRHTWSPVFIVLRVAHSILFLCSSYFSYFIFFIVCIYLHFLVIILVFCSFDYHSEWSIWFPERILTMGSIFMVF